MGIAISNIFSAVQSNLGDDAMDAIHIGHYVDTCNRVANIVAMETQMWVGRYEATPVNDLYDWSSFLTYTRCQLVTYGGLSYISLTETANEQPDLFPAVWALCPLWANTSVVQGGYVHYNNTIYQAVQNTSAEPPANTYKYIGSLDLNTSTVIIPFKLQQNIIAPFKFISVFRGYPDGTIKETTEYSMQSVQNTQAGVNSFRINNTYFDGGKFATDFVNKEGTLIGDIKLEFADTFLMNERVYIDYISQVPFKISNWNQNPPIMIPEFVEQSFIYGLTWLLADMLYNRGNQYYMNIADRNKAYFDRTLRDAVGYTRMLRNNDSTLQMQPINWLPEV